MAGAICASDCRGTGCPADAADARLTAREAAAGSRNHPVEQRRPILTCLIFDSDGTLVDSERLNCQALAMELRLSGIDVSPASLLEDYRGWQLSKQLEDLQQRHRVTLDAAFVGRFRDRAMALFTAELVPIAGVVNALEQIPQPMCVASNGPVDKLQLALSVTGLQHFFGTSVYSAYSVGSFKPDPGLFLHAAAKMGCLPAECIVIEDSEVGIRAAAAAGMRAVLYNPENLPIALPDSAIEISCMTALPDVVARC